MIPLTRAADTELIGGAGGLAISTVEHVGAEIRTRTIWTLRQGTCAGGHAQPVGTRISHAPRIALSAIARVVVGVDADPVAQREPGPAHAHALVADLEDGVALGVARGEARATDTVLTGPARLLARSAVQGIGGEIDAASLAADPLFAHRLADALHAGLLRWTGDPAVSTVVGIGGEIDARAELAAHHAHGVLGQAPRERDGGEPSPVLPEMSARRAMSAAGWAHAWALPSVHDPEAMKPAILRQRSSNAERRNPAPDASQSTWRSSPGSRKYPITSR